MIKSLSVKNLNHEISDKWVFNEDLNIITGKNGSGKTTLLKLLWYLISGNLERIVPDIPFQMASIETDSFILSITQDNPNRGKVSVAFFDYQLREFHRRESNKDPIKTAVTLDAQSAKNIGNRVSELIRSSLFFPSFRRIEGGYAGRANFDIPGSREYSALKPLQQAMEEFSSEISLNGHAFIASISTDDIGQLLEQKYGDVHRKISNLQSKVLNEISQRLEDVPSVMTDIQQVADERNRLLKPFSVLSELTQSILQYESIRIGGRDALGEATEGIILGEGTEGTTLERAKEAIASDMLSSGEKQMLSFLCYNAFNENTAIFIDEPELSLHVDWQRILLPTLLEQGTDNQFFIATHSPFIYAKYPDKEIPLGEKGGAN